MNEIIVNNADAINSQTLLQMVNEARKLCGEKPVRNNDFIAKVKDELDGEGYEIFVTPMDKEKGGADQVVINMTYKQAMRVAARESKAVRRSLVDQLEELQQKALAAPQQQPQLIPGTPEHFLDFITQGVTQALTQAYREYFGEPVLQNALVDQQQHTEPVEEVKALPPAGEHHPCPANKISFSAMEPYVSNKALRLRLLEEFGLEGELFDPGCVKGTNTPAKPYVVYDRVKVMAVLKAVQKLGKNGKEKVLGRSFIVKTIVPVTSYAGDDFDAAYALLKLLER